VKFLEIDLPGAFLIDLQPIEDERGFFARSFCLDEFKEHGIGFSCVQCNVSFNKTKGTLRGMHYQCAPHEEAKIVSCIHGAIYDVIVDIRPDSPTYKKWFAKELSAQNRTMLFVPKGFAHGFQTLTDNAEVFYMMSEFYHKECTKGIRWDDRAFGIKWPNEAMVLSNKDRFFRNFISI